MIRKWMGIARKIKAAGWRASLARIVWLAGNRCFKAWHGCHAQYGEDAVLYKLSGRKNSGFYVDVGSYHPSRMSNTFYLYCKGWRGITIEPDPSAAAAFRAERPGDIHLTLGLGAENGVLPFHRFDSKTRSTFSEEEARDYVRQGLRLVAVDPIPVRTLADILREHGGPDRKVDLLSLDTEGYEMQVLRGNDWDHCRPTLICLEGYQNNVGGIAGSGGEKMDTRDFLEARGYAKVFDNKTNCIYRDVTA